MGVPYSDDVANHYWKCAFDGGEYGLGRLANQLELGCDCLGAIRYFDIPSCDDFGNTFVMKMPFVCTKKITAPCGNTMSSVQVYLKSVAHVA
ncbi:hypothetical protein I6I49_01055 (plasmid) [Acinetobacter johnsonii]|nr:hypothetical protein [Acinetobacter johnsonii]QQV07925.1 hypothetical protein I6I49_01055 [Acinetobacter johnsonii]